MCVLLKYQLCNKTFKLNIMDRLGYRRLQRFYFTGFYILFIYFFYDIVYVCAHFLVQADLNISL